MITRSPAITRSGRRSSRLRRRRMGARCGRLLRGRDVVASARLGRGGARPRGRPVRGRRASTAAPPAETSTARRTAARRWKPLRAGPAFPGYVVTGLDRGPADVPGRLWARSGGPVRGRARRPQRRPRRDLDDPRASGRTSSRRARSRSPPAPGDAAAARGRRRRRRAPLARRRRDVDADRRRRRRASTRSSRSPSTPPIRRTLYAGHVAPGVPHARRRRDLGADRRGHGPRRDRLRLGLRREGHEGRLGLDVRLGLSDARTAATAGPASRTGSRTGARTRCAATRTGPASIYAATVGGLHRSTDDGETWTRISRESLVVTALEVDRADGTALRRHGGRGRLLLGRRRRDAHAAAPSGWRRDASRTSSPIPNDPTRVFFFRAYGGDESGVWEAQGTRVRRVSRDALPAAASLAAFRGADGRTVLVLSSSAGVRISRDGGERWTAPAAPPPGVPIALFGSPFDAPDPRHVRRRLPRRRRRAATSRPFPAARRRRSAAELLSDADGDAAARGAHGRRALPLERPGLERPQAGRPEGRRLPPAVGRLGGGDAVQLARGEGRNARLGGGRPPPLRHEPARRAWPSRPPPPRRADGSTSGRPGTGCFCSSPRLARSEAEDRTRPSHRDLRVRSSIAPDAI